MAGARSANRAARGAKIREARVADARGRRAAADASAGRLVVDHLSSRSSTAPASCRTSPRARRLATRVAPRSRRSGWPPPGSGIAAVTDGLGGHRDPAARSARRPPVARLAPGRRGCLAGRRQLAGLFMRRIPRRLPPPTAARRAPRCAVRRPSCGAATGASAARRPRSALGRRRFLASRDSADRRPGSAPGSASGASRVDVRPMSEGASDGVHAGAAAVPELLVGSRLELARTGRSARAATTSSVRGAAAAVTAAHRGGGRRLGAPRRRPLHVIERCIERPRAPPPRRAGCCRRRAGATGSTAARGLAPPSAGGSRTPLRARDARARPADTLGRGAALPRRRTAARRHRRPDGRTSTSASPPLGVQRVVASRHPRVPRSGAGRGRRGLSGRAGWPAAGGGRLQSQADGVAIVGGRVRWGSSRRRRPRTCSTAARISRSSASGCSRRSSVRSRACPEGVLHAPGIEAYVSREGVHAQCPRHVHGP